MDLDRVEGVIGVNIVERVCEPICVHACLAVEAMRHACYVCLCCWRESGARATRRARDANLEGAVLVRGPDI